MNRRNPVKLVRRLGFLLLVGLIALGVRWFVGNRPIAYHNASVRYALGEAVRIEIEVIPRLKNDGTPEEVADPIRVTSRSEMDELLRQFELPWQMVETGTFHMCSGHLNVRVFMPDSSEYLIRYDHGKGIYPIAGDEENPGFCELSEETCGSLNSYFFSKGLDRRALGISGE